MIKFQEREGYRKMAKNPTVGRRTAAKKIAAPAKEAVTPEEQEKLWEKAMKKGKGPDITYNMVGSFKTSNIIMHDTFGRGVVLNVCPNKMTISFRDKDRILVSSN